MSAARADGRLLLLACMIVVLGVVIPGLLLAGVPGTMSLNVFLAYGLVLWSTWRLTLASARGQRRLTLMLFYVFIYVFFGVQPLRSIWVNVFPLEPFLTASEVTATIGIIVTGIIAFELAYSIPRRVGVAPSPIPKHATAAVRPRPVTLVLFGIGMVAATALVAAALLHYGTVIFFAIRGSTLSGADSPGLSQTEWLLVIYGLRVLMAVFLFMAVYLWKTRRGHDWPARSIWTLRLALLALILVNVIVSNPLSAARLWSGSILMTVAFIALRWRGARSYILWTTGAIAGLLIVFAGIDPRRIINVAIATGEPVSASVIATAMRSSVAGIQADPNFDAFAIVGLTRNYAEHAGLSFGRQLLLPAFFWVPRSIWPGKPVGLGDQVGEFLNLFSVNVSAPLWAEGYANLGLAGVALLLAAFGWGARVADDYLVRTTAATGELLPTVASAFFAANTLILLRGDLTTGTMFLQMVVGFTFGITMLVRRRSRGALASTIAPQLSQA